ncbi:MAG: hypothetical protein M2R45_03114 [Verrucomicrobia subdivision 3 bacterium]|nr:hypothetical protein [Limisphaerales bacterium]MCS1413182.1 hypothetical protein [Limisphaerales bacterium]
MRANSRKTVGRSKSPDPKKCASIHSVNRRSERRGILGIRTPIASDHRDPGRSLAFRIERAICCRGTNWIVGEFLNALLWWASGSVTGLRFAELTAAALICCGHIAGHEWRFVVVGLQV